MATQQNANRMCKLCGFGSLREPFKIAGQSFHALLSFVFFACGGFQLGDGFLVELTESAIPIGQFLHIRVGVDGGDPRSDRLLLGFFSKRFGK